jgi:hypothetical protein
MKNPLVGKLSYWSQLLFGNERQPRLRSSIPRRGSARRRSLRVESLESRTLLAGIARFDFDAGSGEVGPAGWTHIYPNINAQNTVVDSATQIGVRLDGTNLGYTATYTSTAVPTDATSANIRNGISSTLASNAYSFSLTNLNLAKSYEIWVIGGNVSGDPSTQQIFVQGVAPSPIQFTQSIASLSLDINTFDGTNTKAITDFAPILVQAPFFDSDLNTNLIRVTVAESTGNGQARVAGVVIREYEANTVSLPASGGPFTLVLEGGNRVVKNNAGTVLSTLDGTSPITINGTDGASDVFNVDLSGGNVLTGGVTFNGGEGTGDDDRLKVMGYNLPVADGVADVTVTHTGAEAGNVVLAGLGTVQFTQIEPLALVGTAADLVITLPAGSNPDATLGDDGIAAYGDLVNDLNTSAVYDSTTPGATFEYTEFSNPTNSLRINRGSASDNLTVLDLVGSGLNSSLTIGAAASEFNQVTFNGPITLAADKSLAVNALGTISLPAAAKIATSGTGSVSLATNRNITQAANSTVSTVNGGIMFSANRQATPTAANFVGITVNGSISTSGAGNISLSGRGGNANAVGNLYGIWLNGAQISSTAAGVAAGTITITGTGGTGTGLSNTNAGVVMENSATSIASVDGSISITGNATTAAGSFQDGIRQTNATGAPQIDITGSGNLTLTGTPGVNTGGATSLGLRLFSLIDVTGPQTTLISNRMALSTSADFSLNAHGNTVTLRPLTDGTPIDIGSATDANATLTLELSSSELGRITAGTLQIGDSNSGTISVTSAINRASLTNIDLTSSSSINFNSSGSIVTNNGNLTLTPGTTGSVGVANPNTDVNVGTTGTLGNLSFATAADLSIVINDNGSGGGNQRLTASGNINLANVDLLLSGSYTPAIGDQFIIVNNTATSGVTSGTFNGLPEGAIFNPSITNTAPPKSQPANLNADFRITYVGGTGNDVVLTALNFAPTLDSIDDPHTILEGAGLQTINLSGISAGGTISQVLTVSVVSDNPALIASPVAVNYTSPSATGSLSYTPEAGQFGTATIVVTVQDDGGAPNTVTRTFTVRVAEVNDAPTAFDDPLAEILEDSGDRVIPFADLLLNDLKGPDNESGQMLTITAVSNVVGGTARIEGTDVIFTPSADFNGAASFVYSVTDDGTTNGIADPQTGTATVTFNITEKNDPPVGGADPLTSIAEDSPALTVAISSLLLKDAPGPANESGQAVNFIALGDAVGGTVQIDNTNIVFTPTPNFNGLASFAYTIEDDGTTAGSPDPQSAAVTASFTVTEKNDAPTGTDDPLASIAEDSGDRLIPFTELTGNDLKGPADEVGQSLTVTSVSDPVGGTVQISGTNVIFSPTSGYYGPAGFVYTLRDDGTTAGSEDFLTSTATVTFDITDKNDPPIGASDLLAVIEEDSEPIVVAFDDLLANDSTGPTDEAGQTLTIIDAFGAVGGTVEIVGETVVFTPADDFFGEASFIYTLQDDGTSNGSPDFQSGNATVTFDVTPINDLPIGQDDTLEDIAEDAESLAISVSVLLANDAPGPSNEAGQTLTIIEVGNSVGGTVTLDGADIIFFTPTPDYFGPASFTYSLRDNGRTNGVNDFLSATATVHFQITPVNDPPSFQVDGTGNQSAFDENPATKGPALEQVIPGWAQNIDLGADNELGEAPSFVVDNDNHSIFAVQPVVDPNGTLRYTPKPNTHGVANVTLKLTDGGHASVQTDFQTGSILSTGTASVSTDFDTGLSGTGPTVTGTFTAVPPGTVGNKIIIVLNKADRTLAGLPGIGISVQNNAGFTVISIELDTAEDAILNGLAFKGSTIDELRLAIALPTNGINNLITLTADNFAVDIATPLIPSKVLQLAGGTNTPSPLSVVFTSQIIGTPANNILLIFERQDRGGLGPLITVNGNDTVNLTGANAIAITLDQTQHGSPAGPGKGTTAQDLVDFIRTSTTPGAIAARALITASIVRGSGSIDIANPPPDNQGNTPTQPPLQMRGQTTDPFVFTIEITKPNKLHNAAEAGSRNGRDVTGSINPQPDGFIVAGDALGVINYINAKGSGPIDVSIPFGPPYPDVNGDNQVAADDVIAIVNWINANPGESEGEAPVVIAESYFTDWVAFDEFDKFDDSLSSPVISGGNSFGDVIDLLAMDTESAQGKRRKVGF